MLSGKIPRVELLRGSDRERCVGTSGSETEKFGIGAAWDFISKAGEFCTRRRLYHRKQTVHRRLSFLSLF
jgi:hypothetical protein